MNRLPRLIIVFFGVLLILSTPAQAGTNPNPEEKAPVWTLESISSFKHDPQSYTQGFFISEGHLYESAGLYEESKVTRWSFDPGKQPQLKETWVLEPKYFAEGAALVDGDVYVLTWKEETGFILDGTTLEPKGQFTYKGQGWGLAWDGERLWRSDGSQFLYPHQPGNFASAGKRIEVTDGSLPVEKLNELEWDPLTGLILANIYGKDRVAAIDPVQGRVIFWLDGRLLRAEAEKQGLSPKPSWDTVLNGLAVDGNSLWLTGKFWPAMFEVAWPPSQWKNLSRIPSPNSPVTTEVTPKK